MIMNANPKTRTMQLNAIQKGPRKIWGTLI